MSMLSSNWKKSIAIFISSILFFTLFLPSVNASTESTIESDDVYLRNLQLSEKDQAFLDKVISVGEFFKYNKEDSTLDIELTKGELLNDYNFTEEQYQRLTDQILSYQINNGNSSEMITPQFHVEDGGLYISHNDIVAGSFGLLAAAQAGPYALQAALIAIGGATSGPVGSTISIILGAVSAPSLGELAGRITWAASTGQGVYVKPVFSYPPLDIGYW
ncbi:hypothetical protein [Salimicrobium jeotgali]|uniref:hypothetical protein n=1 Tax=Salimicrobium jeotgali TaxID=1230341 RepID=UPI0011AF1C1A|nr:hypothetical protein [Salimicrobium jeotgali]